MKNHSNHFQGLFWAISFSLLVLTSCQGQEKLRGLNILLKLPVSLSRDKDRWKSFVERAAYLEVLVYQRSKKMWAQSYAVAEWNQMKIPHWQMPKSEEEEGRLVIKIWDKDKKGILRKIPILMGSRLLPPLDKWEEANITIQLSLQMPEEK